LKTKELTENSFPGDDLPAAVAISAVHFSGIFFLPQRSLRKRANRRNGLILYLDLFPFPESTFYQVLYFLVTFFRKKLQWRANKIFISNCQSKQTTTNNAYERKAFYRL
jgi:hypothetical protein